MKNFKYLIPAILIASLSLDCYPQNLIANGSFEDANTCTESDAECAPEAWKTTSPFLLVYGGQSNKCVAFTVFNPSVPNTRKYLQIKLLCPLVKDKLYRFSLRLVPGSMQIESIGVLFSDSIIFYNRDILIRIKPTIDFSSQMSKIPKRKRSDWNHFTIEYKAQGFEKYLIIGNFQPDAEQIRTFVDKPKNFTNYSYSIDDVELIPIDSIELCPDYEKIKEKLYSLNDRHPLKRYNLFGDDDPKRTTENEVKPIIDTIRLSSILFEFDSFKINPAGKQLLDSLFYSLNKENIDFIKTHGHTDSIGDQDYNIKLSLNRANAIKDYLLTQNLSIFITDIQGYGDRFPMESNLSESGRQKNRRVEVIIKYNKINR
jgi:outer membrane protein OmpA-like peptidoglycan-associated protein